MLGGKASHLRRLTSCLIRVLSILNNIFNAETLFAHVSKFRIGKIERHFPLHVYCQQYFASKILKNI